VAQLTAADTNRLAAAVGVDRDTAREWIETARTYKQYATDGGEGD
jgi:hypothetical protein